MLFGYLPIKILFHWPGPSWTWISPLSSAWVDKNSSFSRMASILWAASAENKSPVDSYKTWRMHVPPMNLLSKSFAKHIAPTRTPKYLNKKAFPLFPAANLSQIDFHLKILSTNLFPACAAALLCRKLNLVWWQILNSIVEKNPGPNS